MNDKELLELAAKAAGYIPVGEFEGGLFLVSQAGNGTYRVWDPLDSDAQALRLAVKLRIELEFYDGFEEVFATENTIEAISQTEPYKNDPYAATRRAIVRAAAEIGRSMA